MMSMVMQLQVDVKRLTSELAEMTTERDRALAELAARRLEQLEEVADLNAQWKSLCDSKSNELEWLLERLSKVKSWSWQKDAT